MTPELLLLVGTLGGSIIGAVGAMLSAMITSKRALKREALAELCDQVESYYYLAVAMSEALYGNGENGSSKTILRNFRDTVQNERGIRPDMTPSTAKKLRQT